LIPSSESFGIDKRPVGGPQAHDKTHLYATGRTADDEVSTISEQPDFTKSQAAAKAHTENLRMPDILAL
jgi:hypothetical protein